jgi:hypothetical protein
MNDKAIIYAYCGLDGKIYGSLNAYKVQQIILREQGILKDITQLSAMRYIDFKKLCGNLLNEDWIIND